MSQGLTSGGSRTRRASANLAVLDGTDVIYLACEECSKMVRAFTVSGARVPAHATGVGKVLLSGLADEEIEARYSEAPLVKFTEKTAGTLDDLLKRSERHGSAGMLLMKAKGKMGCCAWRLRSGVQRPVGRSSQRVRAVGPPSTSEDGNAKEDAGMRVCHLSPPGLEGVGGDSGS